MFLPKFSNHLLPSGPGRDALLRPCSDLGLHRPLDHGLYWCSRQRLCPPGSEKTELVTYGYQSIQGAGLEQEATTIAPWALRSGALRENLNHGSGCNQALRVRMGRNRQEHGIGVLSSSRSMKSRLRMDRCLGFQQCPLCSLGGKRLF